MARKTALFFAVSFVIAAAAPATAKNAKFARNVPVERTTVERMPLVFEPGNRATPAFPPDLVGRAYQNAVRQDADRQMNRGY